MRASSAGSGGRARRAPKENVTEALGVPGVFESGGQCPSPRLGAPAEGRRAARAVAVRVALPSPDFGLALDPGVERAARPRADRPGRADRRARVCPELIGVAGAPHAEPHGQ